MLHGFIPYYEISFLNKLMKYCFSMRADFSISKYLSLNYACKYNNDVKLIYQFPVNDFLFDLRL